MNKVTFSAAIAIIALATGLPACAKVDVDQVEGSKADDLQQSSVLNANSTQKQPNIEGKNSTQTPEPKSSGSKRDVKAKDVSTQQKGPVPTDRSMYNEHVEELFKQNAERMYNEHVEE